MPLSDEALGRLTQTLIVAALDFLGEEDPVRAAAFESRVRSVLAERDPRELDELAHRFVSEAGWGYHPPNPLARAIHHVMGDAIIDPTSGLVHSEHLQVARDQTVFFVANHLSYADVNVVQILMHRAGFADVASRLTAFAGPKVYTNPLRRFSSLCFGTIKTPQSTTRASEEAIMPAREVARVAKEVIAVAAERRRAGDHLLMFVEGSRSRDTRMQPALAAVSRYIDQPGTLLIPLGIMGTELLQPVGMTRLRPARIRVGVGEPLEAGRLLQATHHRRVIADVLGFEIARCLDPAFRGAYTRGPDSDNPAAHIADALHA